MACKVVFQSLRKLRHIKVLFIVHVIFNGCQAAFYNTEAIVMELVNAGKSIADARLGGTSGCVETGAFGNEAYILNGYFNLPKILEITLHNGFDPVGGKQLGLKLGCSRRMSSIQSKIR